MDLPAIAASAAGVVATHLQSAAGAGSTAAGDALYRLVATKLRQSEYGADLLARLERQPADADTQHAIAALLTSSAGADSEFAGQLRAGVEAAYFASQGATGPGATPTAESTFAGAPAIQGSSPKIGTGGLIAIFVGVALALGAVITAAVVVTDLVSESPEEVAESYLDAATTGQPEEAIKYLCYQARRSFEASNGGDTSDVVDFYRAWEAADPRFRFFTEREAERTATVRVDVSATLGGERETTVFRIDLVKEDDDWKICDIRG